MRVHRGEEGEAGSARAAAAVRTIIALLLAAALALTGATVSAADSAPVDPNDPKTPVTVTADSLPTAQHDGVAWQTAVIGNTVYVAGRFNNARPFGAAPGTQEVPRSNLLAFNLTTGQLIPGFAPVLNAQALSVAASPDGSRIYVGGDFTYVNGVRRWRVAALDAVTGNLINSFAPKMAAGVRGIAVHGNTVWMGGTFNAVGSVSRPRLAAVNAADGALLPWNPIAGNGKVNAVTVSPDGTKVVVGGAFTTLNGSDRPGYGLGMVDAVTGANLPLQANDVVRDGGRDSAILSLTSDGTNFYGTGYIYGTGGNLEGAFSATWSDGRITWVEDCHGDSYGVFASDSAVYVAGHAHYCQNLGGFPEVTPRVWHRALAFSKAATGTLTQDTQGYPSFPGQPAPSLLTWFPYMDNGTASGQSQGPWAVTGNNDYVVMVGEFRNVNQQPQQGLARFARKELAPNLQGPRVSGSAFVPTLSSPGPGRVRVQWPSNWDRDNSNLTYRVYRDSAPDPVYTVSSQSTFWQLPTLSYNDAGLAAGQHSYRITATDPLGNTATGDSRSLTIQGSDNVPPSASFTSSVSELAVSVDASASADPDGTIAGYAWDFGDGGSGTGVTASHSYAAAGSYTITLTVTDDAGATATSARSVTVAEGNVPPSASFTSSVSELAVSVDASASADPDGTIAGYSWDFGDGGSGTGVTASHSYAAAGSYTITLTVTDDAGATATSARSVTVAEANGALLAQDAFARSETAGWGSADIGGEWSVDGSPSVYFVTGGNGVMSLTPGKGPATFLPAISSTSSNSLVTVSLDKIGNGGGTYLGVSGRRVGAAEYRGKVKVSADGSLALRLTRHSGTSETTLAQSAPGITLAAGQRLSLRVEVTGVSPTTVRARTWLQGTPEPGNWSLSVTDNTAGLQVAGAVGMLSYLSGSASNDPVLARFDDLEVSPG